MPFFALIFEGFKRNRGNSGRRSGILEYNLTLTNKRSQKDAPMSYENKEPIIRVKKCQLITKAKRTLTQ
jgi:hypothetical protein